MCLELCLNEPQRLVWATVADMVTTARDVTVTRVVIERRAHAHGDERLALDALDVVDVLLDDLRQRRGRSARADEIG